MSGAIAISLIGLGAGARNMSVFRKTDPFISGSDRLAELDSARIMKWLILEILLT
jgi:hypothetical protein